MNDGIVFIHQTENHVPFSLDFFVYVHISSQFSTISLLLWWLEYFYEMSLHTSWIRIDLQWHRNSDLSIMLFTWKKKDRPLKNYRYAIIFYSMDNSKIIFIYLKGKNMIYSFKVKLENWLFFIDRKGRWKALHLEKEGITIKVR